MGSKSEYMGCTCRSLLASILTYWIWKIRALAVVGAAAGGPAQLTSTFERLRESVT